MTKKVMVIGLDGLEPAIVETMLRRNELPNFAKVCRDGSYSRLKTTYPAQTPVAWSSFMTGTNPGGHGIFDFISRDPSTYLPDIALNRFERPKNMLARPRVVNQRKGVPIWEHLTKAGIPSTILRCPCTFPTENLLGQMLAGVGVPDLRGSQGMGTFYTSNHILQPKEHEQLVYLDPGRDCTTRVIGPRNTNVSPPSDVVAEIRVLVDRPGNKLSIITGGAPQRIEVPAGTWSPWVRLKFKISMLQSTTGIVRFYCLRLDPFIEFYASPVNFDPASPPFPICSPADYGKRLAEGIGNFSTIGMAEDHTGLNNGRFDENAYSAQCELVFTEREQMTLYELARFTEGFFFVLFDTPDRVQHMFWRFIDKQHPFYDRDLARDFAERVGDIYRRCDALLGRILDKVDENTLLIVVSDHGFKSFRRAFHTNTWLWQNGFLALRDNKKATEDLGDGFVAVDWSKTYAYAVGLGGIYLNVKDRESQGICEEGTGQAERVRTGIQKGLADFVDRETQSLAVRSVSRKEELYNGAYVHRSPDLLVNFCPGFRVSWQTSLGGFGPGLFENNNRTWSGDHIMDPDSVPGILLMNRPVVQQHTQILDMAPTILKYLDVPRSESMEGKTLI